MMPPTPDQFIVATALQALGLELEPSGGGDPNVYLKITQATADKVKSLVGKTVYIDITANLNGT